MKKTILIKYILDETISEISETKTCVNSKTTSISTADIISVVTSYKFCMKETEFETVSNLPFRYLTANNVSKI